MRRGMGNMKHSRITMITSMENNVFRLDRKARTGAMAGQLSALAMGRGLIGAPELCLAENL